MPAGRPPKYQSPEELQEIINLYFLACKVHQLNDPKILEGLSDKQLMIINDIDDTFPSITGLALALDLTRKSLLEYEGKEEFVNTIKKAKTKVEAFVEQRLYHANATGSIFNLKNNFGWKDKTEQELSGAVSLLGNLMGEIDGKTAGISTTQA